MATFKKPATLHIFSQHVCHFFEFVVGWPTFSNMMDVIVELDASQFRLIAAHHLSSRYCSQEAFLTYDIHDGNEIYST